jgi:photosystem II stability/assembly factor-like uncharacterized protein
MKKLAQLSLFSLMILSYMSAYAGDYWFPANGSMACSVLSFETDDNGNIYSGMNATGLYKYDSESDLFSSNLLTGDKWVYDLFVSSMGTVYAATNDGVFSSQDGKIFRAAQIDTEEEYANKFYEDESGTVYCAFGYYRDAESPGGIFKTTNSGHTWHIVTEKETPIIDRIVTEDLIIAGTLQGIIVSNDGGSTWTEKNPTYGMSGVESLTLTHNSVIVRTTEEMLFRSSDFCETWERITSLDRLSSNIITDPDDNIWLSANRIIYSSTDGGATWDEKFAVEKTTMAPFFIDIDKNNKFYMSDADGIISVSDLNDNPENMETMNIMGTNCYDLVFCDNGCIWSSMDYSVGYNAPNWPRDRFNQKIVGNIDHVYMQKTHNGYLFSSPACCSGSWRIHESADLSLTDKMDILGYCFHDYFDKVLAGGYGGLLISTDIGETWSEFNNSSTVLQYVNTIEVTSFGDILVGARQFLYKSTDETESWEMLYQAPSYVDEIKFLCTGKNDALFFYESSGGIQCSEDDGDNWHCVSNDLPDGEVTELVTNSVGKLYAAIKDFGIFESVDNGKTWEARNSGLKNFNVNSIVFDDYGFMYACTLGSSFFVSEEATTAVKEQTAESYFTYPTPFSTSDKISFSNNISGNKTISLISYDGRIVQVFSEGYLNVGQYGYNLNNQNLSSGVYYLRVESAEETFLKPLIIAK